MTRQSKIIQISNPALLSEDLTKVFRTLFLRRTYLAASTLFFFASSTYAQQVELPQASDIDWVNIEDLDENLIEGVSEECCGRYIEPEFPIPDGPANSIDLTATRKSSYSGDPDNNIAILDENVEVIQLNQLLQADYGLYDISTEVINLNGNVKVRKPGMLLVGTNALIDQNNGDKQVSNASYVLHQESIRGTGDLIMYTGTDGIVTIDNALYTRCEPADNSWVMSGSTVTLNQEKGRGVAYNAVLKIKNIPVFYSPWMSFPINDERATGFLFPTYGTTSDGGFDLTVPYYLNLAPNYDATLTPRLLTDRGVMLSAEARHKGKATNNIISLNYLSRDKLFDDITAGNIDSDSDSPPRPDRWLVDYNHQSSLSNNWGSWVSFAEVSDKDYFIDFSNTGTDALAISYLTRTAQLNYHGNNWDFSATTDNYQALAPISAPFNSLPKFNLDGFYENNLGIQYSLDAEYVHYYREIDRNALSQAQLNAGANISGQRLSLEPAISWPWSTPGAFITPTIKYKSANYQLEDQAINTAERQSRGLLMASIDGGLIFERDLVLSNSNFTQTLEPRIYYLNSGFDDQDSIPIFDSADMTFSFSQLFREDRFSGKDRVGDANQLTLAVTTQLLDENGAQKASASIGQILHFEDREVTLYGNQNYLQTRSTSSLVSQLTYQFSDFWKVSNYLEWDSVDKRFDAGSIQFRYQPDSDHLINLSYRYRDDITTYLIGNIDTRTVQTDVSAIWPIYNNWGLVAKYNYDHANHRILESIVGVEYDTCCWNVRLVVREWIEENDLFLADIKNDTGIFLQFELKGLGSVLGGGVSGILSDGIPGFREHEYAN